MDNPVTLATLGKQDTRRIQKKTKSKQKIKNKNKEQTKTKKKRKENPTQLERWAT